MPRFRPGSQTIIEEGLSDGQIGLHLGKAELGILEIHDALPECPAVLDERYRLIEGTLGRGMAEQRPDETVLVQRCHHHFEAAIFRPVHAGGRNPNVIEE